MTEQPKTYAATVRLRGRRGPARRSACRGSSNRVPPSATCSPALPGANMANDTPTDTAPVTSLVRALGLAAAQLHGDESPKLAAETAKKVPVIKVLPVGKGTASPQFSKYRDVSAFLLDAPHSGQYGGTGRTADWTVAQTAAKSHRILLAGGLTPENVAEAILSVRPYAVDVTSGVESKPGKKDPVKLRAFFKAVARANQQLCL